MKDFALIGASGFVAPRHMTAIRDTGNRLQAALDPFDSAGILDQYFPEASFFTEFERFDRHLDRLRRQGSPIDYLSVCSPNYLHDAHIRFGLRHGAHVICEKPLVLNPWNVDGLELLQQETGRTVYNLLQLRHHPAVAALKQRVDSEPEKTYDIDLTYITARGRWYYASWKGDPNKSGGIATNIGIHFFDLLLWIFGPVRQVSVHVHTHDRAAGFLMLDRAQVRWFLSINADTLPEAVRRTGKNVYRSLRLGTEEIGLDEGFTGLHTVAYQQILNGMGFGIADARPSLELAHRIRTQPLAGLTGDYHPLAALPLSPHPFAH